MVKFRVLHIVSSLSKVNGVMSVLMNIYRNIDSQNIQFDFLVSAKNDLYYQDEINRLGGKVYIIGEPSLSKFSNYISKVNKFFKENSNQYDIVHCHVPPVASIFLFFAWKNKIEYRIVHSHGTMYGDRKISIIRNFILQIPIKLVSNVYFACSEKAGIFLFGTNTYKKGKVYIVKNAINPKVYKFDEKLRKTVRKELSLTNEVLIGHVGAFVPVKNHIFIIDILEKLTDMNEINYKLILVGDGPLIKDIKELIAKRNLTDKVIFAGLRNDVNRIMQALDILLLPSIKEGLPLVAIESQAASLPVLLSDSITKEVGITKYSHFLSIKSPEFWADKIMELKNVKRYDTTSEIVEAGYDSYSMAENLYECYSSLLKNSTIWR
ncbi:hypothetical protein L1279_000590 [Planomicrobium sp. HSC-17F08]|nr:hypothetical protein [Planomicrobium sp. HSC-17F08]